MAIEHRHHGLPNPGRYIEHPVQGGILAGVIIAIILIVLVVVTRSK